MKDNLEKFLNIIDVSKTHITGKLPFIWVFGSGGDDVIDILKINSPLNPGHKEYKLFKNINYNRPKYVQWCLEYKHDIEKYIKFPEQYPEWIYFNTNYTNLVDFEKDIVSISMGTIIFSESIGAYTEIGMLSCYPELHKNILIIVEPEYIDDKCASFFNLGAITKIRENEIPNLTNIWGIDKNINNLKDEFNKISTHFLDIITTNNSVPINLNSENHVLLLFLDLIVLFPNQTKKFYTDAIQKFQIQTQNFNFDKFLSLLKLLDLVESRTVGNNKLYKANKAYQPCVQYYIGNSKKLDRAAFLIEIGK